MESELVREQNQDEEVEEWLPLKQRQAKKLESIKERLEPMAKRSKAVETVSEEVHKVDAGPGSAKSLFEAYLTRDEADKAASEEKKKKEEEEKILQAMTQDIPLQSIAQRAHGVVFSETITTTWRPPAWATARTPAENAEIRSRLMIDVDGENVPPPLERFVDMKLPKPILECLEKKRILKPSPIQIQGLPVILSGRDMIGVAHTGSGKTMVFTLPLVMFALEEEMRMPLRPNEGPIGLILCPGRELASQTYELVNDLTLALTRSGMNYPVLSTALLIGGTNLRDQERILRNGVHIIVATPGRLIHFLKEKRISMMFCKYLCMDEADRLIDLGFEEDIRTIMDAFVSIRQTVLFSATMPKTIQNFAKSALANPIEVNVGRAGAASLDVLQEVEYVTQENKIVYLLDCLAKTPPPVLIFCENKSDVDSIHEYLLIKGVRAVAIHGGKDQQDRLQAVADFKSGFKDVLIATDIASKGLDFPQIQHVINFDMPKEIENYVHRIGRTGRGGHTGVATTFINKQCSPTILLDLKQLLIEAKQRVPPFLEDYIPDLDFGPTPQAADDDSSVKGCSFCGGLGHRITNCPKAEAINRQRSQTAGGTASRGLRGDGGGGY